MNPDNPEDAYKHARAVEDLVAEAIQMLSEAAKLDAEALDIAQAANLARYRAAEIISDLSNRGMVLEHIGRKIGRSKAQVSKLRKAYRQHTGKPETFTVEPATSRPARPGVSHAKPPAEPAEIPADSDSWATPGWLMSVFEGWFDPCPLDGEPDGLTAEWDDGTYVNPPYSNPLPWCRKAIAEYRSGKRVVLLLRNDSSTKWYQELAEAGARMLTFNDRLAFGDGSRVAAFSSILAILAR